MYFQELKLNMDIHFCRPQSELLPNDLPAILGKKLKQSVKELKPLSLDDLI